MAKIITLIKKTYRCLRKKGINGIIEKIDNVSQTKTDVIGFYDYIMDVTPIPFDEEAYNNAKGGPITLNWVIPEMGIGSGGLRRKSFRT